MKKLIRIAFIDDDESFLFMLPKLLEKISPKIYEIRTFNSSKEAFFDIDSNPLAFDVIVSDYDMPHLDGLELFSSLGNSNIIIPFILLTGNKNIDLPSKALNSGIKFFLRKENDILSTIKQLDQLIKITVKQSRADSEIIENIQMIADFISVVTDSYKGIDNDVYSQLLFRRILESLVTISDSTHGFINEVQLNYEGEHVLSSKFLTLLDTDSKTESRYEIYDSENFPFKNLSSLYESLLIEKRPVIENNLTETNVIINSKTFKESFNLQSFLGLPILFQNTLVGIIGLINKGENYTDSEIIELQPLIMNLANYMYLKMFIEQLNEKSSMYKQT